MLQRDKFKYAFRATTPKIIQSTITLIVFKTKNSGYHGWFKQIAAHKI